MDLTKKMALRKNESIVDETFFVWETRFGLWSTQTIDGYEFDYGSTGMTREAVVKMTRWTLKHLQEGTLSNHMRVVGSSYVGGKL